MSLKLDATDLRRLGKAARTQIVKVVDVLTPNSIDTWRWGKSTGNMHLGPEDQIHIAIMGELRLRLPAHWVAFHIPSEAKRSRVWWGKLFALGFILGLPDILILIPGGRVAAIEVKTGIGKLTPAQLAFQAWCTRFEVPHLVARSTADLEPWLSTLPTDLSPRI